MSSHSRQQYERSARGRTDRGAHSKPENMRRPVFVDYHDLYVQARRQRNLRGMPSVLTQGRSVEEPYIPLTQEEALLLLISGGLVGEIAKILKK